jgi:hypothetical protein
MMRTSRVFEPFDVTSIEPYTLSDKISLSEKDHLILDYLLEWGDRPIHASAIARGITLTDKSGKVIRSITRKHVIDRCKYLEKIGILKHTSKKPPRGAKPRTPHYYLSEGTESFQTLVELYLNRGNFMKRLIFMQSKYTYSAIEKNITEMLVRWLVPDDNSEFFSDFVLLLVRRRIRQYPAEYDEGEVEFQGVEAEGRDSTGPGGFEYVQGLIQELKSLSREQVEGDILSLFEELGVFTEEQKRTYANMAKISPSAVHLLVFLPFAKLWEQYRDLGLHEILDDLDVEPKKKARQKMDWWLLNKGIYGLLYHSMKVDVMRYPFLVMRTDKRKLFHEIVSGSAK